MVGSQSFIIADSIAYLDSYTGPAFQTTIFDPPYNIGFDYGPGGHNDKLPAGEYQELIRELARASYDKSLDSASFFMIHYPEATARLLPILESAGWIFHQWISWVYPSNVGHSKTKFTTAHRTVLWLRKAEDPKDMKFNRLATYQAYKNPNDKRIKERIAKGQPGPALYDWWEVNLCKNVSSDFSGYFNQMPQALLEIIVKATSDPGDYILDPCGGSGSTAKLAFKLERHGVSIDKSPLAFPGEEAEHFEAPADRETELKTQIPQAVDQFKAPAGAICDEPDCEFKAVVETTYRYMIPEGTLMASRYHCIYCKEDLE